VAGLVLVARAGVERRGARHLHESRIQYTKREEVKEDERAKERENSAGARRLSLKKRRGWVAHSLR
jgi:hypothetical protein